MEEKKTSKGCLIASIASLVVTGLEILSGSLIIASLIYAGTGPGSTAITNEAVAGIVGMMFFIAAVMILSAVGAVTGLIVGIIDLVKKQYKLIWMPIISLLLGVGPWLIVPLIMVILEQMQF
ncbi:MAG: hypothetical protein K6G19_08440 [Lachnospiraceae bacterium]|nr:hypothetical protein [Lachnospiraceae bacterium]